jgi:acyl carrier protein
MKIEDKVISIVRTNIEEKEPVVLSTDLRKELRLDSFGTLMLINALEESFGIAVEEADFSRINTVADIVSLLQSKYHCA